MSELSGRRFYKMTGSGNDFIFFEARPGGGGSPGSDPAESAGVIRELCARGTGVGADGLVLLSIPERAENEIAIRYYNADGSRAQLCGNATLCAAALAAQLGVVNRSGFTIRTDSGPVSASLKDGIPRFELPPISEVLSTLNGIPVAEHEAELGFATVGVPHVVILVPSLSEADVEVRGRAVRHSAVLPLGANVNFVSDSESGWLIRTYERGVEGETLACGTGCVASAVLLRSWGAADGDVTLETKSGQRLVVAAERDSDFWRASLSGEGRLVYSGRIAG